MVQLVQLGFFHDGPFVLGIAVAPPVQSSVAPEESACAAPKDAYAQFSQISVCFVMILVSSMVAAMVPISKIAEEEDLSDDSRSVMVVRILRGVSFAAVVLSAVAMGLGCIVLYHLLVVKSTVPACWSMGSWAAIIGCYAVIGIMSFMYYVDLVWTIYSSA
jgi:hypothetical protein